MFESDGKGKGTDSSSMYIGERMDKENSWIDKYHCSLSSH